MIIIIGAIIVLGSVLGGFIMAGGYVNSLIHISEIIIIAGAALGALIIMSPKKVLVDLVHKMIQSLKGAPYNKLSYEDLLKSLYELFLLGRRNGMIALEEHIMNPKNSSIFSKYPSFINNKAAVEFLCNGLRPIVDGKIKPDQLRLLMETEIESMEEEFHAPVSVLTKAADAMPGFGIVAAVLGIVITMGAIAGPIEHIGEKVAAALVGTFLGIFLSYGFLNPLAVNIEFVNVSELAYSRCIASAVIGFATGMAPIMAVEVARRGLSTDVRPSAEELEAMLKKLNAPSKPS
ncbi:MAG TPA: flagellar motor stator protein MotA [Candidatus Paceibacterota bacterium]|nr:flagellar motor stator protein MotA [Verrucomicrobiota bacterium]HRY48075.1 flagellar motor stator protein MotA [Candidatus Paceibacterota bacterium]HSA00993.1 flagellar motor stator protein MotA [Candidatus Paceibacterota bacterium]